MDFDVVIATRNREDALRLSLPLIANQSRRPSKIIIVDSSDDPNLAYAASTTIADAGIPVLIERSAPGSSLQRNRGIDLVTSPVVIFPDDDSLLHQGAAEAMMKIYESDENEVIAGVCASETFEAPKEVSIEDAYSMRTEHLSAARNVRIRNKIEKRITEINPFQELAKFLEGPVPEWLEQHSAVQVEYMTGFRMSFRTSVIKAVRFEDSFSGYGLFEDVDASFAAKRLGLIVGSKTAKIYHHRFPSGRPNHYAFGAMAVLNRAFVVSRHSGDFPINQRKELKNKTRNYALLRMAALMPSLHKAEARENLKGTKVGLAKMKKIFRACPEDLVATYNDVRNEIGL